MAEKKIRKVIELTPYEHHEVNHAAERKGISIKAWIAEAITEKLEKEK